MTQPPSGGGGAATVTQPKTGNADLLQAVAETLPRGDHGQTAGKPVPASVKVADPQPMNTYRLLGTKADGTLVEGKRYSFGEHKTMDSEPLAIHLLVNGK